MSDEQKPDETPEVPQDDQDFKDFLRDLQNDPEPEPEPEQAPDPKSLMPIQPTAPAVTDQQQQQIAEYAKKFTEVANEILSNYKADRDQINDTIVFLENLVFNSAAERVHVEMLVAAERTKAETNATAVKLLDSYAKFLSATKGTNVFVQNNNLSVQDDLKTLLSKPLYPDEQKNAKDR